MSSPKRNTKKTCPQNKTIKTKKNIKYKAFTKNSVQSNKSQLRQQSQEIRNAKEVLMMQSERFCQQQADYGFAKSHYQRCSTFDKQSNGDWGTEMIQQIQISKREQLLRKQKAFCKINKNIVKQKSPTIVPEQPGCKNNQQKHVNRQTIETQINKMLEKQKQSFEKDKNTYQKDINKVKEVQKKNQKCKEIKKININTKYDKIFNGPRVKVRQKTVQPQCFGLSPKQVVFDSKIFTQKTMTLQKNCSKNQQQADKKKTIQYTSLSKSRRIHHMRTCSQNNSYLALKKQKNITNPQSMGGDRKLSQVLHSTSYQPLNSKWIKQNKMNPILIKQQVNPHTFCIKQMVASFINKKQSQNIQKSNNQKIIKQFIYKPIQLTKNKKQKMKDLRHRAKYKSGEETYYQYFTHSLTKSQKSCESKKEKDQKQIKIKNMHFLLDNKQENGFKVQNIFNKAKIKDKEIDKNKTQGECFQKRSDLLLKKQKRIKTELEMTKVTYINPYMLKIIQIQQKYKQKIELQKLDIKNVFLS